MVAENRSGRGAEALHLAQYCERIRAPIDEIADEPQAVVARGKTDQLEKVAELRVAALDVADRVVAHWCTLGADMRGHSASAC